MITSRRPTWLVLVLSMFAALAAAASAQSFDAATRTVTVAPSGVDDTAALRAAFDICQAVGPGCAMQLTAGLFRTRQLEVWGFQGTFAGAGMDATIVETLAPLPISPPEFDVFQGFADPAGGPVWLSFRDARMHLRDLTLRNAAEAPTMGWRFGRDRIQALWGLLVLEGTSMWVDVERVAVEAVPDDRGGFSVENGVWIRGLEEVPGGPIVPMTGTVTIRDSRIHGPESGLFVTNVEGTTVVLRDSVIEGWEAVGLRNVGTSLIEVGGNDLMSDGPAVVTMIHVSGGPGNVPSGPSTLVLADNALRARHQDPRARAFLLIDQGRTASQFALVARNTFELAGGAAVGGAGEGLVVRDNRVTGRAGNGILVGGGPPGALASGWLVVGNDFSELVTTRAAIAILPVARGAVVVCDSPVMVDDLGRDSLVACD